MAQKELTFFLVDTSPAMYRAGPGRSKNDLEYGLDYVKLYCSTLVAKNRKSDRVGFATFNRSLTPNDRFSIISETDFLSYQRLKKILGAILHRSFSAFEQSPGPDFYSAAISSLQQFQLSLRLKFTRTLILISNLQDDSPFTSSSNLAALAKDMGIQVILSVPDLDIQEEDNDNILQWRRLFQSNSHCEIYDTAVLNSALDLYPSLKRIASRPVFVGELRFGATSTDDFDLSLSTSVHTYPACNHISNSLTHSFVVSQDGVPGKDRRDVEYFIRDFENPGTTTEARLKAEWLDEQDEPYKKVSVERKDCVPGFKYARENIIALKPELAEVARLETQAGIDITGFIKKSDFVYALLVDDAQYVVPAPDALVQSKLSFHIMCKAMLDLKCIAITRYVATDNANVYAAALVPLEFELGPEKRSMGFTMTRLAFKEDESLGRFVSLTRPVSDEQANDDGENDNNDDAEVNNDDDVENDIVPPPTTESSSLSFPSQEAQNLMDEFILSKCMDDDAESNTSSIVSNPKLALCQQQTARRPQKVPATTDSMLLASCPKTCKFEGHLINLISKSLSRPSLTEYIQSPNFVETEMVKEGITNLYNLSNIIQHNTCPEAKKWLGEINRKSTSITKRLLQELDCKYERKDTKAQKTGISKPNMLGLGDENRFDSFFDIKWFV